MKIIISLILFILGICLGSFFACIGYRIPNKISTIKPGSFCPHCKEPLKWYMNIPLFSYIFLKGRCKYCNELISPLYFITELLTGVLFAASYLYFDFCKEFFIILILISVFSVTLNTDLKYYYISDRVIALSIIGELIVYLYYLNANDTIYLAISAVVMFGIMFGIKILGDKVFKKESLGGGDIKLTLLIGFTLGIIDGITSLLIASASALVISLLIMKKNKEEIVPFGPFLIIGTIVMYILAFNGITIY